MAPPPLQLLQLQLQQQQQHQQQKPWQQPPGQGTRPTALQYASPRLSPRLSPRGVEVLTVQDLTSQHLGSPAVQSCKVASSAPSGLLRCQVLHTGYPHLSGVSSPPIPVVASRAVGRML